jgi:RES domain-containing protein
MPARPTAAQTAVAFLAAVVVSVVAALTLTAAPAVADTGTLARTGVAAFNLADGDGVGPVADIGPGQRQETGLDSYDLASGSRVATRASGGGGTDVFHATTSPGAAQGVANGINPARLNPNSRFGRAFYAAESPETALAEMAHHGASPTHGVRFSLNTANARVLDLADSNVASAWGYSGGPISSATQAIGPKAVSAGFNTIRYPSLRGSGMNWAVLDDFDDLLVPQMITPTG